ncbi:MAG: exodeoxyribonuclease III [Candidatus Velthaea sp.]
MATSESAARLKVATFNINGVNGRLNNLLAWLETARPDVVCLQEIKCRNSDFPHAALHSAGYGAIWRGQGPHHGVAILSREVQPIETRRDLPGDSNDLEARYLEAAVDGVLIGCIYLPNGNPQPGPKFAYKLAWFERLITHAAELEELGVPAVLVGDYNVVPTDEDIYAMRSWRDNALVQPEPRAAFLRLLNAGWTDAVRRLHPDAPMYTFWDYKREAWKRDAGMRLDHLLVSRTLVGRLADAGVDRDVRGHENASDHVPAWIELTRR